MDIKLENMSYQEFKKYCSDRASDGQWSMLEAMACLNVIEEIDKIKVKSVAPLFGDAIKKIFSNESVSELF